MLHQNNCPKDKRLGQCAFFKEHLAGGTFLTQFTEGAADQLLKTSTGEGLRASFYSTPEC